MNEEVSRPSQIRKLAAIMFTDIVGYTSLMGSDEDTAFEVLRKNQEIHTAQISRFNGTLIKEMGDGMLITFHLASEAVRCGIEIQKACKEQDIPLKIGIHEGEIVFAGEDVLGDNVNIASRLQEDTDEGGIHISSSVYKDVKNKADIHTRIIGEKVFKNVDEPVKVYEIIYDGQKLKAGTLKKSHIRHPGKKSIIVLPFENMSPDPDQEYFSDGLTEEIISDLSHIKELLVISRSSAMTFKGAKKTIREIAEKVNVEYVLEGSVRKSGSSLRITAQLINADNDSHLWAEKYNGSLDDIFDIQESVSREIVASLKLQLNPREEEKLSEKPFKNQQAYECWLKAREAIFEYTADRLDYAKEYLQNGLDIIGDHPLLYAGMGLVHAQYYNSGLTKDPGVLKESEKYIQKAFQLDPEVFLGHYARGFGLYLMGDNLNSIHHLRKAIEINPSSTDTMRILCYHYAILLGKTEIAAPLAQRIMEIDPLVPLNHIAPAMIYWAQGNFPGAKVETMKYFKLVPDNVHSQLWYTTMLLWNGEYEEAHSIIVKMNTQLPRESLTKSICFLSYAIQNDKKNALSVLSKNVLDYCWNYQNFSWQLAEGYALLNEEEEALKWLRRSIDLGFINYPLLNEKDPFLKNIRGTREFKKLMKRVKKEWKNYKL